MSTAVPEPAPRSRPSLPEYNHLRALLAFMLIAMVGLSVALIVVAERGRARRAEPGRARRRPGRARAPRSSEEAPGASATTAARRRAHAAISPGPARRDPDGRSARLVDRGRQRPGAVRGAPAGRHRARATTAAPRKARAARPRVRPSAGDRSLRRGPRGRHPRVDAVRVRRQHVRSRRVRWRASVDRLQRG